MSTESQPLLSVIIPIYNEEATLEEIVRRTLAVDIDKEIILVDDGSTDGTHDILKKIEGTVSKVIYHERNQGKGAAVRTGIQNATGKLLIIQDADLEYDPNEFPALIQPILDGVADVVYGSRFVGHLPHRVHLYWHRIGNGLLTLLSNMATNINLTDMETCYKVFRTEIAKKLDIQENSFGMEPEITAKVSRMQCRIYEIGISYRGRGYDEGKKIGLKDAFRALYCIIKYNFFTATPERFEIPEESK